MKTIVLTVLSLTLLLAPRQAAAQGFITPFVGFDFGGDAKCPEISDCEDKTTNFGVAVGTLGPVIGFEEEFAYAKDFFGTAPGLSSSVLTVMSNVVIGPKISLVRPYVVGGVGLIKTKVEFSPASLLETSNNGFGWDLGGGLVVGSEHVGIRGDIRYFHSFKDLEVLGFPLGGDTKLDFGRASVGLFLGF
jgi:opacity protein-like surface antigen